MNLGCGQDIRAGFINVDKFGQPDVLHDLEVFPWPWPENSVGEVLLNHVLEHLGETTAVFRQVIRELYRVCAHGARLHINVPHPRHDDFLNDPTHVRVITPDLLDLFSKAKNREWAAQHHANSPLAMYWDVDFQIVNAHFNLDPRLLDRFRAGELSEAQVNDAIRTENNAVKEIRIILEVQK